MKIVNHHTLTSGHVLKPYTVYYNKITHDLVVYIATMEVPYFDTCMASDAAFVAVDIEDEKNWNSCVQILCWDILDQKLSFCNGSDLEVFDKDVTNGYIPFDKGSGRIRSALALVNLANKCWDGYFKYQIPKNLVLK